jgi:hypothetical protein
MRSPTLYHRAIIDAYTATTTCIEELHVSVIAAAVMINQTMIAAVHLLVLGARTQNALT